MITIAVISSLATLALLLSAQAAPYPTLARATEALARGEDVEAAFARIKGAGQHGLWALHDAAKHARAQERGRLFEAVGRIGTPEAEWALVVELQGSDPEGKVGAVRGLTRLGAARACAPLMRIAAAREAPVRDAVVEALVSVGGCGEPRHRALLASAKELERELGLRYLVRAPEGPLVSGSIGPALHDPSTHVRRQGVELVRRTKDQSWIYMLSELARGEDTELAGAAVETLSTLGGFSATSELGSVAADPSTREMVWRRAAAILCAGGADGFRELLGAIARARQPERRQQLAAAAAEHISEAQLEAAVELLDEPNAERAAVGRAVLESAGEPARAVARRRMSSALPELQAAITAFLEGRVGGAPAAGSRAAQ